MIRAYLKAGTELGYPTPDTNARRQIGRWAGGWVLWAGGWVVWSDCGLDLVLGEVTDWVWAGCRGGHGLGVGGV